MLLPHLSQSHMDDAAFHFASEGKEGISARRNVKFGSSPFHQSIYHHILFAPALNFSAKSGVGAKMKE